LLKDGKIAIQNPESGNHLLYGTIDAKHTICFSGSPDGAGPPGSG
jgi:hypothetical protein